ncbi:MerR family transcriptional regulator [Pseudodonghicola xiamenensis]|uniref:HTH merR-type domain-containing protein n=1 Tax=Pseudodonghicola xiamenensis TaxID=337702 RepID=A0A8J3MCZ0_9RHOB|nr:MerR family transcriptional regulator [Pseudodonghicola xiamenensis]GHG80080.1 hypothetical protein GCM10010961_02860 [Pseudodonghicola xiamenensis]
MTKSPDAFRTISEVAAWLGVQAHVLRFWESKFTQVKPVKRAGGRRYYRPSDMRLIGGIKTLLHDDGMTIKGVQKILREQGVAHVATLSPPLDAEDLVIPPIAIPPAAAAAPAEERGTVLAFKAKPSGPAAVGPAATGEITEDIPPDAPPPAPPAEETVEEPPRTGTESPDTAGGLPRFEPQGETVGTAMPEQTPKQSDDAAASPQQDSAPAESLPAETAEIATAAPEAASSHAPGLLGHLAGIAKLTPLEAARIAPFTRALRDWYDRQEKALGE